MRSRDSNSRGVLFVMTMLAAGAACRSVAQPGSAVLPAISDPMGGMVDGGPLRENAIDTSVDAGPAISKVEALPRWGKLPETSGELFAAVDGDCWRLGVSVLENETLVHYSQRHAAGVVLGRVTDDAIVVEPALMAGLNRIGNIGSIAGRWPDQAYLAYDNGLRAGFANLALHYDGGKWKDAFALPNGIGVDRIHTYLGGAIGLRQCDGGQDAAACVAGVYMGDNAKAPPIVSDGFDTSAYDVTSAGDIFAVGSVCPKDSSASCTAQLRWWSPGAKKVGYSELGPASRSVSGSVHVKSSTEVYLGANEHFAMFDGTKVTKLTGPGKTSNRVLGEAKDGALWVEGDSKVWQRKPDGTYEDVTPPAWAAPREWGKANVIVGLKQGAVWALAKDAIYKRIGDAWQKVELPRPPFSSTASKAYLTPETLSFRAPDDVLIVASYFEGQPGWGEIDKRRTLLRTKRMKETMRCDTGRGFDSWPPPAGDTCMTPFVLLSAVSADSPKDYDDSPRGGVRPADHRA